ncbi:ankyrin repeat protein [Apiospora rasikravindrae]|uniref:Ankyrin repeat protein n=1 Tax=Apiospora rasikravindrae TaxID=990691 RepID=A0ABR1S343_9PEZI
MANGIEKGLFLHEFDAFVLDRLDDAVIAHDEIPWRVTSKTEPWKTYSLHEILKTALVTRGADVDNPARDGPDFASTYLTTSEKVLSLLNILWDERLEPVGRTLQIDLREDDFAQAIPHYCYHISKRVYQYSHLRGAHHTTAWKLFQSTMLKGYNIRFDSFDHLQEEIKKKSIATYGRNYFETRHLHMLPPLIMVFSTWPIIKLAEKTKPADPNWDVRSYEHIRDVVMKQVSSYVRIGADSYNFILELAHSGLGLGYDVKTKKAVNPLNGTELQDPQVIFNSLVDRAMIDVSLELRKEYPELLFASCTRLPDVITSKGKFKAGFKTSRLEPWKTGEQGLDSEIRAMHGGLYPQSHISIADNPTAEIAARTWIDQKAKLERSELLLGKPYFEWLAQAGQETVDAVMALNGDFLPNKFGEPVEHSPSILDNDEYRPSSPVDSTALITSWLQRLLLSPTDASTPLGQNSQSGETEFEETTGQGSIVLGHNPDLAADATVWEGPDDFDERQSVAGPNELPVELVVAGRRYIFNNPGKAKRAASSLAIYNAAFEGNEEIVHRLISKGVDVNTPTGFYGSALGAACANGHKRIVELLLRKGANAAGSGNLGSPLELSSAKGHSDIVMILLEEYSNIPGLSFKFALHEACANGHETTVQLLLKAGADVNCKGGVWNTPLQAACHNGNVNIVNNLLRRGAEVNAEKGIHGTALICACMRGHEGVVRTLLNARANVNAHGRIQGTALSAASLHGYHSIVELLLNGGAHVNDSGEGHGTALRAACVLGHLSIVKLLLDRGADANAPGSVEGSALRAACVFGNPRIVELLLEKGAKVDAPGENWTNTSFKPEVTKLLQEAGANMTREPGPYPRRPGPYTKRRRPIKATQKQMSPYKKGNRIVDLDGTTRRDELVKQLNAPPLRQPPMLRSCGCLICTIDQVIQPAIPRHPVKGRVRVGDPVSHTLNKMRQYSEGS